MGLSFESARKVGVSVKVASLDFSTFGVELHSCTTEWRQRQMVQTLHGFTARRSFISFIVHHSHGAFTENVRPGRQGWSLDAYGGGRVIKLRASLYADDAAVFLNPLKHEVQVVATILHMFGQASGLHINLSKCAVYPIHCDNVNMEK